MVRVNPYIKMKLERARGLVSAKDYSQAQQEVQEALEEAPNNTELLTLLANIYTHQERLTDATLIIDQLLQAGETGYDFFFTQRHILYQPQHLQLLLFYLGADS